MEDERQSVHIAVLAGGVTSAYVAFDMVKRFGKENSRLIFIDTFNKGADDPAFEANTRFMKEVADYIGLPLIFIKNDEVDSLHIEYSNEEESNSTLGYSVEVKLKQLLAYLEEVRKMKILSLYCILGLHQKKCIETRKYAWKVSKKNWSVYPTYNLFLRLHHLSL
ncbi:hypothetical protein CXF51_04460 [Bacillus subtilis subsp. subtilis]|nr:hypothetical protein CXF51_04460 [Bacillus subtilis subsp. subtilis]